MFALALISRTEVNWDKYLQMVVQALNRSPTGRMDENWIKLNKASLGDYYATLVQLDSPGQNPEQTSGSLLEHIHLGFLLVASKSLTHAIVAEALVRFLIIPAVEPDFSLSLLTGTVAQWRVAIQRCCSDTVTKEIREFGTECLKLIEEQDLPMGLPRVRMGDGTVRAINQKGNS